MKSMLTCGAAALVLLAMPAAAQNTNSKTIDPHQLAVNHKTPPLQLTDQQRAAIQDALVSEHTQQKTPKDFKPQVGAALPKGIKIDVMPEALVRKQSELKQYGYAKTASDILVIDPMSKKIVAVLPRKFPADASAKTPTPADWAQSHAQELTGKPPQGSADRSQEDTGDAAAVGNGNGMNGQPQESGLQPGQPGSQSQK